jgi:hypothetical protein
MGNWRTVTIVGECAEAETGALRNYLKAGYGDDRWGCLHGGGICGLPNWAGHLINWQ